LAKAKVIVNSFIRGIGLQDFGRVAVQHTRPIIRRAITTAANLLFSIVDSISSAQGGAGHLNVLLRILSLPARWLSKVPGLGSFVRVCSTSVGQKILMACTGLALCGFLIAHLAGNLKLLAGESSFNEYALTLHSLGPILAAAEVGLFALFVAHIGLAVSTAAMNRMARKKEYSMKETKQGLFVLTGGVASNWMMVTGILVLVFLVVHITDMKLKSNPGVDYSSAFNSSKIPDNEFRVVRAVLATPLNFAVYVIGLFALGIHLSHGVASALQTLGVNHKRWNPILRLASIVFAWSIAAGFLGLLVWAAASPS
jgi:succinate dehydrogenase / fumarate reductase cytochrome b subunit